MKLVAEARTINMPAHIPAVIDKAHPGAVLVTYLANRHPHTTTRDTARRIAMREGKEPRHAAAFEWLVLRINDTLPLIGWRIDDTGERYRLEKSTTINEDDDMPEAKAADPTTVAIRRPVEVTKTLADQYTLYERCGRELRDRLRRELLTIQADHERHWADIKQQYDHKISEAVAALEQQRAEAQAVLIETFHTRKNEIAALLLRIED